jgi:hypothetical protein
MVKLTTKIVKSTDLLSNNITTESLKDDKKEAVNVVNFLRETGLIYQI